jgi:hypothetical protein
MPEFHAGLVGLGALGGLLPDVIRFAKNRQNGFPEWFKKPGYWVGLAVLVVLGGLAAWLGQATDLKTAIAFGFSAPEILSRLFADPTPIKARNIGGFPIRSWWAL